MTNPAETPESRYVVDYFEPTAQSWRFGRSNLTLDEARVVVHELALAGYTARTTPMRREPCPTCGETPPPTLEPAAETEEP